jgi:hypothetical protein
MALKPRFEPGPSVALGTGALLDFYSGGLSIITPVTFPEFSRDTIIGTQMLEKRRSPRRKMVLPVKVLVDNLTHLAHTIDITRSGARLGALRLELQPGTTIGLQRGSKKAKFKIAWVRQVGPTELQAGIESVEPQSNFWGVDLSDKDKDVENKKDMQALMTMLSDSKSEKQK